MQLCTEEIKLTPSRIKSILKDGNGSAAAVNLVYVHDGDPGIRRQRKGNNFTYLIGNKKLKAKKHFERIKSLVIPPAWEDVWICISENGHLQATGYDAKKRKQYRYHKLWNVLRNQTKFYKLHEFGEALPKIRTQLKKDLSLPGLPQEKVLALVVSLMEYTNIRIGNQQYENLYGSYGLTTLKDQHVQFNGAEMKFIFKGKKGVTHAITLRNKKLSALVKKCRDIPGKELFQYIDKDGSHHHIDSGMVNEYIKRISGGDFSAKDFRTWSGTIASISYFCATEVCETKAASKKAIVAMLDNVAAHLGNTRTVCKKHYVHPVIIDLFEKNRLGNYIRQIKRHTASISSADELRSEEKILLKILKKEFNHIKI